MDSYRWNTLMYACCFDSNKFPSINVYIRYGKRYLPDINEEDAFEVASIIIKSGAQYPEPASRMQAVGELPEDINKLLYFNFPDKHPIKFDFELGYERHLPDNKLETLSTLNQLADDSESHYVLPPEIS